MDLGIDTDLKEGQERTELKKQVIFVSKNFIPDADPFCSLSALQRFVLVSMAPLDPLQTNVGQAAMGSMSPEQIERLRLYWGEGIPPLKRYLAWAGILSAEIWESPFVSSAQLQK